MLNQTLLKLAQQKVRIDADKMEKVAVVPPPAAAGAPPMDPAMMAGGMPPGAPPMDPSMMGGMPPMDPSMMGGMPPGAPPMDPSMMGGAVPGAPPADPAAAGGAAAGGTGQKMKPEQYMQMLDFRLYNMQQMMTTLLSALDIKLDPSVLLTPPGVPGAPPAESALPGGPGDPTQQAAATAPAGGGSAITGIEPLQGASPELAAGGGGAEKAGAAKTHLMAFVDKLASDKADTCSTEGDVDEVGPRQSCPPSPELRGPHPGVRPATQNISAGGSKDPVSRPETEAPMTAVNKQAELRDPVGTPFDIIQENGPQTGAAAVAAIMRSRTAAGRQ